MKLKLNKKSIKNLSKDAKALPEEMTPQVAGGIYTLENVNCDSYEPRCIPFTDFERYC